MAMEMSDALKEKILTSQNECTFMWGTRDGSPSGTLLTYVWHEGSLWMSSHSDMPRIRAVRKNPKVAVTVSSAGTEHGVCRSITFRGTCRIHEMTSPVAEEFAKAFIAHLKPRTEKGATYIRKALTGPGQVALEVVPEREIRWDGHDYLTGMLEA